MSYPSKNKQRTVLLKYYNKRVKELKQNKNTKFNFDKKTDFDKQIRSENESIKQLRAIENENQEMRELIDELMQNKEISTFENGKYSDTVREVYAALLSANVGVKNVEFIVRTVLDKLGGVKVGRLPKKHLLK